MILYLDTWHVRRRGRRIFVLYLKNLLTLRIRIFLVLRTLHKIVGQYLLLPILVDQDHFLGARLMLLQCLRWRDGSDNLPVLVNNSIWGCLLLLWVEALSIGDDSLWVWVGCNTITGRHLRGKVRKHCSMLKMNKIRISGQWSIGHPAIATALHDVRITWLGSHQGRLLSLATRCCCVIISVHLERVWVIDSEWDVILGNLFEGCLLRLSALLSCDILCRRLTYQSDLPTF